MMNLPASKSALAIAMLAGALPLATNAQDAASTGASAVSASGLPQTRYVLTRPKIDTTVVPAADMTVTESDRLATEAVALMYESKFMEASAKINQALRMRVDRSYYHLINGLIYHLQARQGKDATYDLAEQGYRQAIQFDNSNWQALYFAGMLNIDTAKFDVARRHLAQALYLHPDDPSLLNAFAYASYRSGVPDQAAGAINAMEAMGGAQTTTELRNAAVIMAAVGETDKAQDYLTRLKNNGGNSQAMQVERRVSDWREIYSQPKMLKTQYGQVGQAQGYGLPMSTTKALPPTTPGTESKMVVVDVVLISTEEDFSSARGVNLLRGLQIQFGNGSTPAYQSVSTDSGAGTATTTITRNISIPSIFYSLNIFNTNNARNEILARPTLVATAGYPSEFFSGIELNAVVSSNSANINSSPVNIQKEIGTTLTVTPSFLDGGRIAMKVLAQRTFIKTPNDNLTGFTARVETSKSKVDASVVLRSGETLILGGLSEKEGENTRDGVPLLQDIPVIQYLFSRNTTRVFQKSTLILITPRPPQYVYQPENARQEYEKSLTEDERPFANLRARYADWFRPYPNWASVFHHLQENPLYREFRTGDVALENWSDMRTLKDRLGKVLEFLHY